MTEDNTADKIEAAKRWFLDRDARDGRSLFLSEWASGVQPDLDVAHGMVEHSVTYGNTAVQTLYVLNGGALAALPALIATITPHAIHFVAIPAITFVFGILCAGASSLSAYANFQFHSQLAADSASQSAEQIKRWYQMIPVDTPLPPSERVELTKKINFTLWSGVTSSILSLLLFVGGVLSFILLA